MQRVVWRLDDYFTNQYNENPQLFETNLHEMFPKLVDYKVHTYPVGLYVVIEIGDSQDV